MPKNIHVWKWKLIELYVFKTVFFIKYHDTSAFNGSYSTIQENKELILKEKIAQSYSEPKLNKEYYILLLFILPKMKMKFW